MITRKVLKINGVDRSFICDTEKDTLADVIRNLGLTGTKVGCGMGHCGACSVILNGKVVRSCVRKMKAVDDHSTVTTIEGLGTAENPHPLQRAMIAYGGIQCGFCTPGFIISAKALLDENPSPTREEVREWFRKNRNACRCTGYKQIVDAVMAAAAVMRGEKSIDDLNIDNTGKDKIFNTNAPKPSGLGKALGLTDFGDDIAMKYPGMLFGAPVMPPISHGIIKKIDFSEAEKYPGVEKVVTAADVKGTNRIPFRTGTGWAGDAVYDRPILCDKKVVRLGDIVAVVLADTKRHAREAAKLVKVEYEELPAYMDVLEAVAPGTVPINDDLPSKEHPSNLILQRPMFLGEDTREVFKRADKTFEFNFATQRQSHLTIEPDNGLAYMEEDGSLTVMYKSHCIYMHKGFIAEGLGLPPEKIRVIMNPSGGAFGYSMSAGMPAILGACAIATGKPVSIWLNYDEHQLFTGKRNASYINTRVSCDETGHFTACELEMLADEGCYPENANMLTKLPTKFAFYPYTINNARMLLHTGLTNTPQNVAYRCPVVAAVYSTVEQLVDIAAEAYGMDPLDFRLHNCWKEGDVAIYDAKPTVYVIEGILKNMRPMYEKLKAHAAAASNNEKKYGVGISVGSFTVSCNNDRAEVALELNPDGTITHYNTWEDLGQGADIGSLAFVHEALRPLGIRPEDITLVTNDTKYCPDTGRAAGSRSNFMMSNCVRKAADALMDAMRKEDGTFRTYDEMIAEGIPVKYSGVQQNPDNPDDDDINSLGKDAPDQTNAGFIAEVEVDTATGKTRVIELHCITDVGVVTNFISFLGQGYSGMMHSLGYALYEDFSDMKKHVTLAGAGFPYIDKVPDDDHFTVTNIGTPRPYIPFGGSGISEAFQSSSQAAIMNAIYKAVGVRVESQPATPEKIKAAMDAKAAGTYKLHEAYNFGFDFYDQLEYLKNHPAQSYSGGVDMH